MLPWLCLICVDFGHIFLAKHYMMLKEFILKCVDRACIWLSFKRQPQKMVTHKQCDGCYPRNYSSVTILWDWRLKCQITIPISGQHFSGNSGPFSIKPTVARVRISEENIDLFPV